MNNKDNYIRSSISLINLSHEDWGEWSFKFGSR